MAAIQPTSPTPPIPLDLRKELFDTCPWRISDPVFAEMKAQGPVSYKKVQVLPTHQGWRFVWRYFHHDKPHRYGIKQIFCIHEQHQVKTFESNLSSIEREAEKFTSTWDTEPRTDQRRIAMQRYQDTVAIFSPFQTLEEDGRKRTWARTKVLPLWHGSRAELCNSICESGFVFFGKSALKPGEVGKGSTDEGYFGSGIYFTNSARYAADIYSQGHLLLAWVSMREPFPVIGDHQQLDMALLKGGGAYKNYNTHYVPVCSTNSADPYCPIYHPAKPGQAPSCDEIVVFHKSQAIPRFWIELEIEVPYMMNPSDVPQFVQELIPHLFKMLQRPEVDKDLKLRNILNSELAFLLKLSADDDLEQKHISLFEKLSQLIDSVGKIDKNVRQALVGSTPVASPPLPQTTTSAAPLSTTYTPSSSQLPIPPSPEPVIHKPAYSLPAQEIKTLVGHSDCVASLAVLPDGTLASGSDDKTIKLWNPSTGACLCTLTGHSDYVDSLAVLPDGILASGSGDRTIKLWNPSTGACLCTLTGHSGYVRSLAALPDGTLASGSKDKTIKLWNPSSGACLRTLTGHSSYVYSLAVLPDGTLVSGSFDNTIKLWNPSTGACLCTLTGHSDYVWSLAVLPDGTLASGSKDKTIKLWNPSTGACLHTLTEHSSSVYSLAVLPDGTLASGSKDKTIKLWNLSAGNCLCTLTGHLKTVCSLAILPDGTLASGSYDKTIKLWISQTTTSAASLSTIFTPSFSQPPASLSPPLAISKPTYAPLVGSIPPSQPPPTPQTTTSVAPLSTTYMPSSSQPPIPPSPQPVIHKPAYSLPAQEIKTLVGHSDYVTSLAVLPDGTLASGSLDKTIKLWNPSSGACLCTLTGHSNLVYSLAVLPDGTLVSGSWDKTIKLWNPSTGACLRTLTGHSDFVLSLAVLPDGTLASGSFDNTIKLWNPSTGACLRTLTGHSSSVYSLAVLPDGTLASGSGDTTIKLWNPSTGACLRTLTGHSDYVRSLAVLPDGTLASGSEDKTIKLWNPSTGACLRTLTEHSDFMLSLAVLPDGTLVSGSFDNTIKLWNPSTGACLRTLTGHSNFVDSLAVLPDGTLASGSGDKTIKLWK